MKNLLLVVFTLASSTALAIINDIGDAKDLRSGQTIEGSAVMGKTLLGGTSLQVEYIGLNPHSTYEVSLATEKCASNIPGSHPDVQTALTNAYGVLNASYTKSDDVSSVRLSSGNQHICTDIL